MNRLPSVTTIIGRFKESGGPLYWANQQGLEGKTLDQARAEVSLRPKQILRRRCRQAAGAPEAGRSRIFQIR
jgi:hypothetical protein